MKYTPSFQSDVLLDLDHFKTTRQTILIGDDQCTRDEGGGGLFNGKDVLTALPNEFEILTDYRIRR